MTLPETLGLWLYRLASPVSATVVASVMTLRLAKHSFVNSLLSDALCRFPRWWRVAFWDAWYPESFYYVWRTPSGGNGPARWFWRRPKNRNWVPAAERWVFRL